MFNLDPTKVIIILVVALIVLGPERLPHIAKQLGGFWGDFKRFRQRLESEVKTVLPDITWPGNSPLEWLDTLAQHADKSDSNGRSYINGSASGAMTGEIGSSEVPVVGDHADKSDDVGAVDTTPRTYIPPRTDYAANLPYDVEMQVALDDPSMN
ncbi:MAG: twin-arginine translocase TatA/TatE family subunit [Actinobacteria bacterium]|nr:twin-arginine translocase TatA/TatE family subunit [Actinomycetota bacterium]MCL6105706.1 twin-arginine translocase TatA/TatE family subunit [Actinomycetota bacterium]